LIGYVTLGTNDLDRAKGFYDSLMPLLGARRLMDLANGFTLYGARPDRPGVAIKPPHDGQQAQPGNGTMTALVARDRAQVDAVHAKALELGAADEGAPGLRGPEGPQAFYGAYFRDLDGNKLCVFRMGPA
jgi:catechol 2,3-dioxygenase-like lactoylglutathione lyase family enzyme